MVKRGKQKILEDALNFASRKGNLTQININKTEIIYKSTSILFGVKSCTNIKDIKDTSP